MEEDIRTTESSAEKGNAKPSLKNKKKVALSVLAVCVLAAGLIAGGMKIAAMRPFAVSVEGENICYVKDRAAVSKVLNLLMADYIPENAEIKAINVDDALKVEQEDIGAAEGAEVMDAEVAAEKIRSTLKELEETDKPQITTVSTRTETGPFTPETLYERDDTMLAGDEEVIKEGKDGQEEKIVSYTCVNGEVTDSETVKTTILEAGESKIVKKGTLGLPDGEDWRTYEGDPVYKNGSEVADTGLQYLGAPYKYGGNSLTNGIDCVQFVRQMYKRFGIKLPNSHKGLQNVGIGVSLSDAKRGDIVCYSKHVAIYLGDGQIVEAVPKKGVRVGKVNTKRLVTIRRVVE